MPRFADTYVGPLASILDFIGSQGLTMAVVYAIEKAVFCPILNKGALECICIWNETLGLGDALESV